MMVGVDPGRASATALGASLVRMVHTRFDSPALIDDDWGEQLVTDAEREMLVRATMKLLDPVEREQLAAMSSEEAMARAWRSHPSYGTIIIRQRFTEDALAAAVARGVRQYVIVGAGMDSFALRRPVFADELTVFEIDHPATQKFKLARLAERGLALPAKTHYLAADLTEEPLNTALQRVPFEAGRTAFFSLLGVTPYLSREADLATLRAIAASAAADDSELVFNYLEQRAFESLATEDEARLQEFFASFSEPWVSGFDPDCCRRGSKGRQAAIGGEP